MTKAGGLFKCAECSQEIEPHEFKTWVTKAGSNRGVYYCDPCCEKEKNSAPEEAPRPPVGNKPGAFNIADVEPLLEALLRKIVANELEPIYEQLVKLDDRVKSLEERLFIRPAYSNTPIAPAKPVRKPFDADAFGDSLIEQARRPN